MKQLNSVLVNDTHGHGAIITSPIFKKLRRALRPKAHLLGTAQAPFDWTKGYPMLPMTIKDQGSSGSCGGQAGAYWRENQLRLLNNIYTPLSAKSLYAPIHYPGGGTTVSALENQLGTVGINLESDVSSYDTRPGYVGNAPDEQIMEDLSWQTPILKLDALSRASLVPLTVNIDLDSMAQAIATYGGIIVEVQGKNGEIPSWDTYNPTPPSPTNPNELWAHFVFCGGAQNNQIIFSNSWGKSVGQEGIQAFTEAYINSGFIVDAFTFIPRSVVTSTGSPIQWALGVYQRLLQVFK